MAAFVEIPGDVDQEYGLLLLKFQHMCTLSFLFDILYLYWSPDYFGFTSCRILLDAFGKDFFIHKA